MTENGEEWKVIGEKITRQIEFPGITTYQVQKLRPDTFYRMELRAHNNIGFSSPAELVIKTANGEYSNSKLTHTNMLRTA